MMFFWHIVEAALRQLIKATSSKGIYPLYPTPKRGIACLKRSVL